MKGRYTVAVKVIDIFGNDTMVLVPVKLWNWQCNCVLIQRLRYPGG